MADNLGRSAASAASGSRPTDGAASVSAADAASIPNADSGNLPGYFAILNKQGQFWSHTVHSSRRKAENYIREFWGVQKDMAHTCLRDFKIIQVRVRLEPLSAQSETTDANS